MINRLEIEDIANAIKKGAVSKEVKRIREVYHPMRPVRHENGQVTSNFRPDIRLPRLCFAATP